MRYFTLILLFIAHSMAGPIYSITDLGGIAGGSSEGAHISNAGQVVGWAGSASGGTQAISAGAGQPVVDLANSWAAQSKAYGVNGSGTVVGTSWAAGQAHGTVWTSGGALDLGAGTEALAINDAGQITGGDGHAFVYDSGSWSSLGTIGGGTWSSGYAINNTGQVAGYGDVAPGVFRAFLWTPGQKPMVLGTLGGDNSYAAALNDAGQIAGSASTSSGYLHAFLSQSGRLSDLGTLGGTTSNAYGVNNSGAVVGSSSLADGAGWRAFLDQNGVMVDLNSLLSADSGWQLTEADGINDGGAIVGSGIFNGAAHAFRLDPQTQVRGLLAVNASPVPEPGSLALFGLGSIALVIRAARKNRERVTNVSEDSACAFRP